MTQTPHLVPSQDEFLSGLFRMSRILVITEKPQASQAILSALGENIIQGRTVDTVFVYPVSWWQWKIPKQIPLRKIPATPGTKDMNFHLNPNMSRIPYGQMNIEGELRTISKRNGYAIADFRNALVEHWSEYELIICMPDDDRNGWGSLVRWIQWVVETDEKLLIRKDIRCMRVTSMDPRHLRAAFDQAISLGDPYIGEMSRQFEQKHIFDAWWNINSSSVFAIAQRKAGIDHQMLVTKYEIMLLQILNQYPQVLFKDFQVVAGMEVWSGTGRYKARPDASMGKDHPVYKFATSSYEEIEQTRESPRQYVGVGIGSAASRGSILNKLIVRQWVSVDEDERLSVTDLGKNFLTRCHNDTFDPDLPFRIEHWIANGDFDSMKRYVRLYFNKQKRVVT